MGYDAGYLVVFCSLKAFVGDKKRTGDEKNVLGYISEVGTYPSLPLQKRPACQKSDPKAKNLTQELFFGTIFFRSYFAA